MKGTCWGCSRDDKEVRMNKKIRELLCKTCSELLYEKKGVCEKCKRFTKIHRSQKTKELLCSLCRRTKKNSSYKICPPKRKKCSLCGGEKRIAVRLPGGGVACYNCRIKHDIKRTIPFQMRFLSPA